MGSLKLFSRVGWVLLLVLPGMVVQARQGDPPYSLAHPAKVGFNVAIEDVPAIDAERQRKQVDQAEHMGKPAPHTKRLQVAVDRPVSITPERNGRWESLSDGSQLWRVRVRAQGATDLRLGFGRYALPPAATLYVIGADNYYQGPYTSLDATAGQFRAPVLPGDTATIELRVPAGTALPADTLELTSIGAGFRDVFGLQQTRGTGPGASGICNINVVCPLGQPYPDEIRAVGHYEFQAADDSQFYVCTGTLLADVPQDRKNWFLTAAHCISVASEAASMVIYWNYQSTTCAQLGAPAGGFFNDDQRGAALRATRSDVDATLVELGTSPDVAWNLHYAGWDASGSVPAGTISIHHPLGDAKKITAGPPPGTIDSCITAAPAPRTHWITGPYSQGTTEGGSSGAGLFVVAGNGGGRDRRLIGTLSGGTALCSLTSPTQPDDGYDCYGKLAVAWNGAIAAARLRDWLDPANTGTLSVPGIDQNAPDPEPEPGQGHSTRPIPADLLRSRQR